MDAEKEVFVGSRQTTCQRQLPRSNPLRRSRSELREDPPAGSLKLQMRPSHHRSSRGGDGDRPSRISLDVRPRSGV